MTVVTEPNPALMKLPIRELVQLTGEAHNDLTILSFALKHRMDEAREEMTMTEIANRTGYTRTTIYNWHNETQ